jgi:hypothetical protein
MHNKSLYLKTRDTTDYLSGEVVKQTAWDMGVPPLTFGRMRLIFCPFVD